MNLCFTFPAGRAGASLACTWRIGVLLLLTGTAQAQTPVVSRLSSARNARSALRTADVTSSSVV